GEPRGDAANQVLDKTRIVVGALRDVFLIRALQDAVQLGGRFLLGDAQQLGDEHVLTRPYIDRDDRTLIVRAVRGNLFRARTQRRYRNRHADRVGIAAVDELRGQAHVVVQQTRDAGDRRGLAHEKGKREFDARARRIESHD